MKKIILQILSISIFFISCDNTHLPANEGKFQLASGDINASLSRSLISRNIDAPSGLHISLRSSDIEFWATSGDYSNLQSYSYSMPYPDATRNVSISIELSDSEDNVNFMPGEMTLGEYLMPTFNTSLIYDVARMDIGNGQVKYALDGSPLNIKSDGDGLGTGIKDIANSIIFIDSAQLSSTVYIPWGMQSGILHDIEDGLRDGYEADGVTPIIFYPSPASVAVNLSDAYSDTSKYPPSIIDFIADNASDTAPDSTRHFVDMSGALFVPFEPIDFSGISEATEVRLTIKWDLNSVFDRQDSGQYILNWDACGTPYDFDVTMDVL